MKINTIKLTVRLVSLQGILLTCLIVIAGCGSDSLEYEATIEFLQLELTEQSGIIDELSVSPTLLPTSTQTPPAPEMSKAPSILLLTPNPGATLQRPPTASPTSTSTRTPTLTHTPTTIPEASVRGQITNLRAGPAVGFSILEEVAAYTPLRVLGKSPDGEWYLVASPSGHEGWMFHLPININIDTNSIPTIYQ